MKFKTYKFECESCSHQTNKHWNKCIRCQLEGTVKPITEPSKLKGITQHNGGGF